MTREKLEALVWKHTHKDYRGTTDGRRSVLHGSRNGTTLSTLASLTERQLKRLLPRMTREIHFGADPTTTAERMESFRLDSIDLGHLPLKQGHSYECSRCGASGSTRYGGLTADRLDAYGPIFADRCGVAP